MIMIRSSAVAVLVGLCSMSGATVRTQDGAFVWGDMTKAPWPQGRSWIVTADPIARECAQIYEILSLQVFRAGRRMVASLELTKAADADLVELVRSARSDADDKAFRSTLMESTWRLRPHGLIVSGHAARRQARAFLSVCESLWGCVDQGERGWLAHAEYADTPDRPQGLLPRIPEPLAFASIAEVPSGLALTMEEALSDPLDALVATRHLAERCQAYGGERSVRLDAWRCVALMAQWGLDQEGSPLRALIPMRAESALSVALQLRLAEQSGLVHGVAGGVGSASEPSVHIAISLAEVRSLKQWAKSMAEVVTFLLPRCEQDDPDLVGVATRVRDVLTTAEFVESLVVSFADHRVVPGRVRVDDLGCLAAFRIETDGRRVRSGRLVEADVELGEGRSCWLNEVFGAGHPRAFRWTPAGDHEVFLGGASRLYRFDRSGAEVLIWGAN